MRRLLTLLVAAGACVILTTRSAPSQGFDTPPQFRLVEATIPELTDALESHRINSKQLVRMYVDRIAAYEDTLNGYITLNPAAFAIAQQRDVERAQGRSRGPLHGIPIVLKDNVHTTDMITTGGALAFAGLRPPYEATLSRKLRDAGAIILGKTVLTELANWVSDHMPGNYSAVGGYGMNPWDPRPDPRHILSPDPNPGVAAHHFFDDGRPVMATGGSSSGIASAANLAVANVGTETSGSILSPSNQTMLAGIKPTVGLISRYGVIPITADQDTAGPMARDVASAAIMLGVMQGFDPNDPATAACQTPGNCHRDYTPFLQEDGLAGARIGVPQVGFYNALTAPQKAVVDEAIAIIRSQGATVIFTDIPSQADGTLPAWGVCAIASQKKGADANCSVVLKYGFKRDFNLWLDSLGARSDIDTLAELIQFNLNHAAQNAIRYEQARLDISEEMDLALDAIRYTQDRAKDILLTATNGIDAVMTTQNLDALLFGGASSAGLAARPGYPTVVVPFGFAPNTPAGLPADFNPLPQPFGISFTGSAFDEPTLIKLAYAFEQATRRRHSPPSAPPLKKDSKGKPNNQ
jgi:amidase